MKLFLNKSQGTDSHSGYMNRLIKYFQEITHLTDIEIRDLEDSMEIVSYSKGDYLLREGQSMKNTYFVLKGCIRHFKLEDGEERTTDFFMEDHWIIASDDSGDEASSFENLICEEDCELVLGNQEKSDAFMEIHPRFESVAIKVMEKTFFQQRSDWISFQTGAPEERYKNLINKRPDIFQRVPLYQIASYIGVKPESLSRIRKRLSQQ